MLLILNIDEFEVISGSSFLLEGIFPINNGPKSKLFSEIINYLEIYDSGGLSGLLFLRNIKILAELLLIVG